MKRAQVDPAGWPVIFYTHRRMGLLANTTLGPYVVQGPLSSGGMGEVYRAHDTQLDRSVALKVLRTDLVGDTSAVARFQREAKLASSLNHPHIISIYSVHETDGMLCIAMELVSGETLSKWIAANKPTLNRILEVFIQIADALAAAHSAGVVHRDLKPGNILVSAQGYAKVLDFGLAKQVVTPDQGGSQISTNISGAADLLGTPPYMSPEQAKGMPVDARTDIFSLGVVLYEAVTGVRPFHGESTIEVLNEVISNPARPAREIKPSLPAELDWILERTLAKQPAERYGAMSEFAADLRRLRGRLDVESSVTSRPRERKLKPLYAGLLLAVILPAVAGIWMYLRSRPAPQASGLRYEQLTDFNDVVTAPALSPDGRMVAFIRGGNFGTSAASGELYVKLLPNGDPIQLTHDGRAKHTPTFTPDGNRIVYTALDRKFVWDSWEVPVLGGPAVPFMRNASGLTFLDEGQIMFAEIDKNPHMSIMTSRLNRIDQRPIYVPQGDGSMAHRTARSPDKKWVLVVEMDGSGWLPCRIVPFDGSSQGRQVGPAGGQCTTASWSPDGKWMYFSSNEGGAFHIWRQAFPDGIPEQITAESNEQEGTAVAPDGKSLITAVGSTQGAVWLHDKQGDRQLTFEGVAMLPKMAPDGKTVFYLQRSGGSRSYISAQLWKVDVTTGTKERVFPGFLMSHYDISADGQHVLFAAAEGEKDPGLWVADLERRRPPRQLTKGGEFRAFFSGVNEIVFLSNGNQRFIQKMGVDGTAPRRILEISATYLLGISPDGQWIAVAMPQEEPDKDGNRIMLIPMEKGRSPIQICKSCVMGFGPGRVNAPLIQWSNDGSSVLLSLKYFGLQSRKTAVLPFAKIAVDMTRSEAEFAKLPGVRLIDEADVFPASRPGEYLMSRRSASSNLFRISLPD
ncbi:MAG TPA: protein kinase [Bryobacteraceae bacterium]|nr:protein kinase [Bryobacteraceae bacterium]